ncbi:MAG TPA: hypothetical protein PLR26_06965 [Bacilli bacterium]|mgnify:CR=1 FL=1|nr:hypothetical protein [Bacilli bacterium]
MNVYWVKGHFDFSDLTYEETLNFFISHNVGRYSIVNDLNQLLLSDCERASNDSVTYLPDYSTISGSMNEMELNAISCCSSGNLNCLTVTQHFDYYSYDYTICVVMD